MNMNQDSLPIIEKWYHFLNWLLDRTSKFPKAIRFTITSRIDNLALQTLEELINARYSSGKTKKQILAKINVDLEKLRFIIRLSYDKKYLSSKSYGTAMKELIEIGKQVGGWQKTIMDTE